MPFWRKEKEAERDDQAERLRKFRNMYAVQYGSKPVAPVREVGEPVKVQSLCTICSEPMETRAGGALVCPAEESEPVLHDHLRVALENWRSGQVQGRVVPHYTKTIGLMRHALKNALERDRGATASSDLSPAGTLPPPVNSGSRGVA